MPWSNLLCFIRFWSCKRGCKCVVWLEENISWINSQNICGITWSWFLGINTAVVITFSGASGNTRFHDARCHMQIIEITAAVKWEMEQQVQHNKTVPKLTQKSGKNLYIQSIVIYRKMETWCECDHVFSRLTVDEACGLRNKMTVHDLCDEYLCILYVYSWPALLGLDVPQAG